MIKFFRQIRKNLLMENKISKYFKYAIGEIVLVIIGILLALQINNWNEQTKQEKDLNNSLVDLVEALDKNVEFIHQQEKNAKYRLEGIEKILNKTATIEEQKNVMNFFGQKVKSIPFTKVFEVLKEDKKLRLIKNKELVKKINQFFEFTVPGIHDYAKWHEVFVANNIDTYIIENIKSDNFKVEPQVLNELLKDLKFNNILRLQKTIYTGYRDGVKHVITDAEELKKAINNYLKEIE